MARNGTLTVRVVSDTKQAEQGLDRLGKKVETTGDKMKSAGAKMTAFATVPIAAAIGLATKAASDLQQAIGGTEAVFGDAADTIEEFGKSSAQNMGLSEREFREATTSIGGQLKRMTGDVDFAAERSVELAQVAADLAATYGGTTAEAVQALGAAFRGEADPAERFNLDLKIGAVNAKAVELGLAATTSEVDNNARAQATLALIMEQSADAQGQFARENDSAAGSMQIARAEMEEASAAIGEALLPMVADLAGGVADLAERFQELPEPVQNGILALAGLTAAAGPVLSLAGNVSNLSGKMRDAEGNITRTGKAARAFGGVVGGIALAGLIYETIQWASSLSDARVDIEKIQKVVEQDPQSRLGEFIEFIGNQAAATFGDKGRRQVEDWFRTLARESPAAAESILKAGRSNAALAEELDRVGVKYSDLRSILDNSVDSQVRANDATERSSEIIDEASGKKEGAVEPTEKITAANEDWADSSERLNDRLEMEEEAIGRVEDAIDKMNAAYKNLIGVHVSAEEALLGMREGFDSLNHILQENGSTLDENSVKGRENRQAITDQVEAIFNLTDAMREEGATSEEVGTALEGHVGHLKEVMRQAGFTEDEINDYLTTLNLTPDSIATYVELQGVAEAEYALALLTRNRQIQLRVNQIEAQQGGAQTSGFQLRHGGGPVVAGSPYLIGRPGHEEMFVPNTSGHVLSGPQTDRLGRVGGGSGAANHIEINLNGGDHDPQSIARHVAWALA